MEIDKSKIGVLFDLDGVIIDTEGIYLNFWEEMNRLYPTGYPDLAIRIKGTNLASILSTYFPNEAAQHDIVNRLNDFQNRMEYRPFPGAVEFLQNLKTEGIPFAIATSSDNLKMQKFFSQNPVLKELITVVVTGDMVTHSKPHPECYLTAAKMINREIENCIVFEDSLQGLAAGRASGAKVVALSTTYPEEALRGKADIIVPSLADFHFSQD